MKWYEDSELVSNLPLRYQAYAAYSRLAGHSTSRRVPGGSFVLRILRDASALSGTSTIAPVRGIAGLTVVTDFADERVLEVIHEIRGENPEYRVLQSMLTEGATFVDVGANFGTFSLLASRIVGSTGRVITIEPQQHLCSLIRESMRLSGVSNCDVVCSAIGSQPGDGILLVPSDDSGRAGMFADFSGRGNHKTENVSVTTLDALLTDVSGSCVIKIDVEGSELDVLNGAVETFTRLRPSIILELNPSSAEAARTSTREIISRLRDYGFASFTTVQDFPAAVNPETIEIERQLNIVATF